MNNPELTPEQKLNQATAEAAAKDLFVKFARENKLSLADSTWELPREEIIAMRAMAAARGLGVDEVIEELPEETDTVGQAKLVAEFIFDELMEKPLPREMLDVKSDEMLDQRDRLIPIIPDMFQEQLKQDYINFQNSWNNPNEFDIEL